MLSICVATTSFPRWKDDSRGTFILESCRALSRLGVRIRVVVPHSPGAQVRETWEGIEVFRPRYLWPERIETLAETPGGLPVVWERNKTGRWKFLPFAAAHALAITRHARGCDLIHAHWSLSAFAARAGRGIHGLPVVCTLQGSDIYQALTKPVIGALSIPALNRCREIIALSRSLAEAAERAGVRAQRITVIPNGVDCRLFRPPDSPREHILLFCGSLIERKGPGYLLDAMVEIRRHRPEYRLMIIGDGPLRKGLEDRARETGIRDSVFFTGDLPPAQVAEWMRRAELFLLPSREEAQGVVLLEALASGTPCVASRTGGIPEILDPACGELVPPADSGALARAALALIADPGRRSRMGQQARRVALEHFDWPIIAGRILAVYESALGRSPVPASAKRNPDNPERNSANPRASLGNSRQS